MEILVPLGFFAMILAIVVVPIWLRERTKQSAHQLISQALEKGQALDPALMERLTQTTAPAKQQGTPRRTLGNGIVLLALAIGFGAASVLSHGFDTGDIDGMMIAALILGALGVAFTLLAIVDYSTKKKDS
jgi:Domain of unknown function (DUF6249)